MSIDVKASYGAKGDGATDDTAAINAAIAAAHAAGGNAVTFPRGTYICSSAVKLADARYVRLQGDGPSSTILRFTQAAADHGLDMFGADHCQVEDLGIISVGGSPLAAVALGRSTIRDGGNCYFKRLQVEGNWPVGFYAYASELNSFFHCNVVVPGVPLFVTSNNILGYASKTTTVKTGGQSCTYGSWHHGQLSSLAALSASYDAAVVLDNAAQWCFYNPIVGTRGQGLGSNVHLRNLWGATQNAAFFGYHFEPVGARGFLVDGGGLNNLTAIGGWLATPTTSTILVGKSAAGGSISGLTLLSSGSYGGVSYQMVDLDSCVDATIQLGAAAFTMPPRFSGTVMGDYFGTANFLH